MSETKQPSFGVAVTVHLRTNTGETNMVLKVLGYGLLLIVEAAAVIGSVVILAVAMMFLSTTIRSI